MKQFRIFEEENITKKEAARIAHDYLKNVLGEKDEDVRIPENLKDIYDCHTCVQHVTQVYFKGIIFPENDSEFGMQITLEEGELLEIEERVLDPEKRKTPEIRKTWKNCAENGLNITNADISKSEPHYIDPDEIENLTEYLIVDVRMPEEFLTDHLRGAINIPLHKINLNPHIICDDKFKPVVFVCENGTNSKIAAEIAGKNGYRRVFYSKYSSDLK